MEDYLSKGKEILKILISNGYEAYFIGDVVRKTILNQAYDDIEITTSATPSAMKGVFSFTKVEEYGDDGIKLAYYGYTFYLSTFREKAPRRKKQIVPSHYSKKLLDELASRDFTINALAMSHSEKITDAYKGYDDIRKKRIRAIVKNYDTNPISMLRAVRLHAETRFTIAYSIRRAIRKNRKFLKNARFEEIVRELKLLFAAKYYRQALDVLISTKLYKFIPHLELAFKYQYRRRFKQLSFDEFILLSFLLNKKINHDYLLYVDDKDLVQKVYEIAQVNPKSIYSDIELFNNGLDTCLLANKINVYLKRSRKRHKKINKDFDKLVIKNRSDLEFKAEDILALSDNVNLKIANEIEAKSVALILDHEMANDYDVLKVFAINEIRARDLNLKQEKIDYNYEQVEVEAEVNPSLNQGVEILDKELDYYKLESASSEEELSATLRQQGQIIKDYTEHRLDMLERRINEQDRLLKEKDILYSQLQKQARERQIQEDIENLVRKNIDMLKESNYLDNPQKDKSALSRELHRVYIDYIKGIEDRYSQNNY